MVEHVAAQFPLCPLSSGTGQLGMEPDPGLVSTGSDPRGHHRRLDFWACL